MNKRIFIILVFIMPVIAFAQELSADKRYNFALILEENKNEDHQFVASDFYTQLNKNTILSFVSYVEFPVIEEKEAWKLGEVKEHYKPIINLDNFYRSIPKFTNFSPYAQKQINNLKGEMKILKGYDFCGRPIY